MAQTASRQVRQMLLQLRPSQPPANYAGLGIHCRLITSLFGTSIGCHELPHVYRQALMTSNLLFGVGICFT